MQIITILLISISLAMDAFTVSMAVSTCGQIANKTGKLRMAGSFGFFQAAMALLGWLIGETVITYVEKIDHWLAFVLLAYVAYRLIRAGIKPECSAFSQDPSTGKTLLMLSIATSIDAFAVGLSITILQIPVGWSVASIGLVAFILSAIGLFAGTRLTDHFGRRMEILGGIVLLIIAFRVVITHQFPNLL